MYDMINTGHSKGVFLLQSPAQLKMAQRLRSRNLLDLAYQVALIRPGVGVQGSAVSRFVERYRHGAEWDYDHPLERRALERGYGDHRMAGAGRPTHRGRGGHDGGGGRRSAPRLRKTQQRGVDRHAPAEVLERRPAQRCSRRDCREDILQDQRPLHVPGVPLPRLRHNRVPGRLAEALPHAGVLRRADEQPADGLLPDRDAEAGRTALRSALPEARA